MINYIIEIFNKPIIMWTLIDKLSVAGLVIEVALCIVVAVE